MIFMNEEIFADRLDAGEKLANLLEKHRGEDAVVIGLPRGGVVVAKQIAKRLNLPLQLVVVRKIGHPLNPEFAIAAISESGEIASEPSISGTTDPKWFEEESGRQLNEAKRRREKYWGNRPSINLKDKVAIIVDDGLATGLTMLAAISEVKKQQPKKIVVAVPISPLDTARKIKEEVDEFVAVSIPSLFLGAVGAYYEYFPQISDEEVIDSIQNPG